MTPRPLPEHIPGVVIAVDLNRLMEYYRLNQLEAATTEANPGMTFPVIVTRPPVPAGVAGETINQ